MTAVEIVLSILVIGQFFYNLSKYEDLNNLIYKKNDDLLEQIKWIKGSIREINENRDKYKKEFHESINESYSKLNSELKNIKIDFVSFKTRREVYSEFLDKANKTNEKFLYQAKELNSKVDDYSKSIDKINNQQKNLEIEFQEINKHLDLIKSNLLIDNYNRGKE